jgi:hypothetical protein
MTGLYRMFVKQVPILQIHGYGPNKSASYKHVTYDAWFLHYDHIRY